MFQSFTLPHPITELGGMKSFDSLSKTDVVLPSTEVEDLKVAVCTITEETSWMDWWMFATKSMVLSHSRDLQKVKHLLVMSTHCQLLVAKTASTVWTNLLLKCSNTVFGQDQRSFFLQILCGSAEFSFVWFARSFGLPGIALPSVGHPVFSSALGTAVLDILLLVVLHLDLLSLTLCCSLGLWSWETDSEQLDSIPPSV